MTWKALSSQIHWHTPPDVPAPPPQEKEKTEAQATSKKPIFSEDSSEGDDGDDLMAIVTMHRQRPPVTKPSPRVDEDTSAADEAAGKALQAQPDTKPHKPLRPMPEGARAKVIIEDSKGRRWQATPKKRPTPCSALTLIPMMAILHLCVLALQAHEQ